MLPCPDVVDGRLFLGPDGRLLLSRAPMPGEADRLRALAGLPGVPALVGEADGSITVTWAPALLGPVSDAAAWFAAVLAAAHARGVVHGPIEADHLRTGVLDGWSGAGSPADDVAAFGRLLLDAGAGPLPPDLDVVARRCVADDPVARPSMAAVAEALAASPAAADPPAARPWSGRRPPALLRRRPRPAVHRPTERLVRPPARPAVEPAPSAGGSAEPPPGPSAEGQAGPSAGDPRAEPERRIPAGVPSAGGSAEPEPGTSAGGSAEPSPAPGDVGRPAEPERRLPAWIPAAAAVPVAVAAVLLTSGPAEPATQPPPPAPATTRTSTTALEPQAPVEPQPYEGAVEAEPYEGVSRPRAGGRPRLPGAGPAA